MPGGRGGNPNTVAAVMQSWAETVTQVSNTQKTEPTRHATQIIPASWTGKWRSPASLKLGRVVQLLTVGCPAVSQDDRFFIRLLYELGKTPSNISSQRIKIGLEHVEIGLEHVEIGLERAEISLYVL